ncbi:MAG TPA: Ig-like domain-containing protein [Pyrinomonadaceae bacterium]|nr:Ig-like domain-containing protein [Pyrinomonadaceae bacterium]
MKSNALALFTLTICFVFGTQIATAQTQLTDCTQIRQTNDFLALADRRAELIDDTQDLTGEIAELEKQLPDAITDAELEGLKKQIDDLDKKGSARTELENQTLLNLQSKIKSVKTDTALNQQLAAKKKTLSDDKVLLQCVQSAISQLNSPDQTFRLWMSLLFGLLIAAVIVSFFVLAFRDEVMRRAIFSGETGIQFLTLFSLVIAIILFGITSILESKELSALLGGLSGYILGRTARQAATGSQAATGLAEFQKFLKDLKSIVVKPDNINLSATAKTQQLVAEPKDANGNTIADPAAFFVPTWESSDTKVAKVDETGLVTMVGAGSCTASATFANLKSDPCQVTVT